MEHLVQVMQKGALVYDQNSLVCEAILDETQIVVLVFEFQISSNVGNNLTKNQLDLEVVLTPNVYVVNFLLEELWLSHIWPRALILLVWSFHQLDLPVGFHILSFIRFLSFRFWIRSKKLQRICSKFYESVYRINQKLMVCNVYCVLSLGAQTNLIILHHIVHFDWRVLTQLISSSTFADQVLDHATVHTELISRANECRSIP